VPGKKGQIGSAGEWLDGGHRNHHDVMVARLKLTGQRAHWIEMPRSRRTDKTDFHNCFSDPMIYQAE
jgi:hypothetical protein